MAPPTLPPPPTNSSELTLLSIQPLTPSSFAPFGTAISIPFPSGLHFPPTSASEIPPPQYPNQQPQAVLANQNSALKTSPISQFADKYPADRPAAPQMSMFSCFPRNLSGIGIQKPSSTTNLHSVSKSGETILKIDILERHPFTTQTFCPLGLAADSSTIYLVIVAPSLPTPTNATLPDGTTKTVTNPPDLSRLRAFLARGNQAVTYGAGTWHAPMVVLGQRRVDFLVTQFVNGVAEDDCQEVLLGENAVGVSLEGLGLGLEFEGGEKGGKAKL